MLWTPAMGAFVGELRNCLPAIRTPIKLRSEFVGTKVMSAVALQGGFGAFKPTRWAFHVLRVRVEPDGLLLDCFTAVTALDGLGTNEFGAVRASLR